MRTEKIFEIQVPIEGKIKTYKTDLICNSCGKQLKDGDYLYFCAKCEDDLCSNFECLSKHAGHRFFRWGRIDSGTGPSINDLIKNRPAPPRRGESRPPIKIHTLGVPMAPPAAPSGPALGVPNAPPEGPPATLSPPISGPTIRMGLGELRSSMLKELKSLKKINKGE
ncbi:MAG: hypothetical protein ACTSQI_09010 [Candidatus Helarchaeota archaeon]